MMRNPLIAVLLGGMVLAGAMLAAPAAADDSLSVYGLKGYGFVVSPIPARGFSLQTGVGYADYDEGGIWTVPVSATYGDGRFWEVAVASHWESWENDDFNVDENGFGDLFVGGKIRPLGDHMGSPVDMAVMPYALLPTGDRDKSIGDLYGLNPSTDDDATLGVNLLLGGRWQRLYLAAEFGIAYADTDLDYIDDTAWFLGLAAEYQIAEDWTSYIEYIAAENRFDLDCDTCYEVTNDDDPREIALGVVHLRDKWGFKLHLGFGASDTAPDFRVVGLVNYGFY